MKNLSEMEKSVYDYININEKTVLRFVDEYNKINENIENKISNYINTPNRLIIEILGATRICKSYNEEKASLETKRDRWRSSLDIWRHAKFFIPEIDILDIMKILSNPDLFNYLNGHYCPDVRRRVFKSRNKYSDGIHLFVLNRGYYDEYGYNFNDWIRYFHGEKALANMHFDIDFPDAILYTIKENDINYENITE